MIRAAAVVIPAHDEAELIARSLRAAAATLAACPVAPARCHLIVVADDCRDATAAIARSMGAHVVPTAYRSAGAARAEGMRHALGRAEGLAADEVWLATTDADSVVPPGWLPAHLGYAAAGWDAVTGTVVVDDWSARPPGLAEVFAERYRTGGRGHPHVHGANLGMRASAYLEAEGFRALACAEDHTLVAAMCARGHRIRRPVDLPVLTSARACSRARGGFGDLLTRLTERTEHGGCGPGTAGEQRGLERHRPG